MTPQKKFKAKRCFKLPKEVFELLCTLLPIEHRITDRELLELGIDNLILMDPKTGSRKACFYTKEE